MGRRIKSGGTFIEGHNENEECGNNRSSSFLLVEMNGIEPSTYALRTHRSPS